METKYNHIKNASNHKKAYVKLRNGYVHKSGFKKELLKN